MNHEPKIQEIVKTLEILHPPEQNHVVEVRILGVPYKSPISGYYDANSYEKLAKDVLEYDGKAESIYVTLNPVDPALLGRANNRLIEKAKATTSDHNVIKRTLLLIDVDPERPSGISSSDEEKKKTKVVVEKIYKDLKSRGLPEPTVADSGNGVHLLYNIDLENNPEITKLIERFLVAVDLMFSTEDVKIDLKVFNAARITKLYGTKACKGDPDTKDRPYRYSKIRYTPEERTPVSREKLEEIAKLAPTPPQNEYQGNNYNNGQTIDIEKKIQEYGLSVWRNSPYQGGELYKLSECPFDENHKNGDASLIQFASGAIAFSCFHDSCSGKNWHSLRDKYEPGWQAKKQRKKTAPENTSQEKNQDEKGYILNNDFKPKLHPAMSFIDGELAYGIPNGKKPQFITNHKLLKYSVIHDEYVIDNYPQQLKFSRSGIKKYLNKEKINATELYNNIRALFENHIIFQFDWQIDLTVTWVIGTYLYRAFPLYPYYWIKSPTKRCGKTRLLELMAGLCFNSNGIETAPSEAVLYRVPDITAGALLWDEVENLGKNKDKNDLISILNTSYREDGKIARCEGKDYKVKFYSAYRPVALAGIRNLPDTVEDRSLKVELLRKKRDEKVKKLQINRIKNELEKLRDDLHIFALEHANLIREAYDDFDDSLIPDRVDDRLRDAFEVMMSVAAGVEYRDPDFNLIPVLKTAAKSLSGIRKSDEDEISFIRAVNILKSKLDSSGDDCLILTSKEAVEMFNKGGIEWVSESKHASSILRNLGFRSGSHRPGDDVIRAYKITKEKIDDLDLRYGNVPYSEEKSEQSVTT
ncbi:MAG: DUF3631 domain-containing protein [Candidatus Dadabacteria bacterium]|nr:DUF3631 domain-containing protein [Candidatus Dadabacteria bacterium]